MDTGRGMAAYQQQGFAKRLPQSPREWQEHQATLPRQQQKVLAGTTQNLPTRVRQQQQQPPLPPPPPRVPPQQAAAAAAKEQEDEPGISGGGSREANNVLYQAIMLHKQRENERQMAVLRENQRITETMVRKRREANENRYSAVTSCSMYTNNAKYVTVNSGRDSRIKVSRLIHPLDPDECDVYSDLVDAAEHSSITAALNHCMNQSGEVEGFSYTCSGSDSASCLPLNRKMFFRCSMVECEDPCSSSSSSSCVSTAAPGSPRSEPDCCAEVAEEQALVDPEERPGSQDHLQSPDNKRSPRISDGSSDAPLPVATNKFWWEDSAAGPDGKRYGVTTALMMDLAWDDNPHLSQALHRGGDLRHRGGARSSLLGARYHSARSSSSSSAAPSSQRTRSCIDRPPDADQAEVRGMPPWKGSSVPRAPRAGRMENKQILRLLLRQKEVKARLLKLVSRIHAESVGHEAKFECMPDNTDIAAMSDTSAGGQRDGTLFFGSLQNRKAADCAHWKPEMPEYVGIYHAYVRGFNKNTKTHKLFIVTQGGCSSLCDNYFNLFVDVRNHMSAGDMLQSEETWYAKKACQRNNARILLEVAKEFNLRIPTIVDPFALEPTEVACCTTETVCNDVVSGEYDRVTVYNKCVNPLSCTNGIVCTMHPSEGVWVFKGPMQTKSGMSLYGGPFGEKSPSKVFPVCTSKVHGNYSWRSKPVQGSPVCSGSPCIIPVHDRGCTIQVDKDCRVVPDAAGGAGGFEDVESSAGSLSSTARPAGGDKKKMQDFYTYIDEAHLRGLQEDTGWSRENGVVELVPIAVVCQREPE